MRLAGPHHRAGLLAILLLGVFVTQPLDAVRSPGVVNEPYRVSMLAAGLVIAGIIGWIRNKRRR